MMPSAASALCCSGVVTGRGSKPAAPSASSRPAADSAKIAAMATTRREPDSAASKGTTTSQTAAKDPIPPVHSATSAASPVSDKEDSTCALS